MACSFVKGTGTSAFLSWVIDSERRLLKWKINLIEEINGGINKAEESIKEWRIVVEITDMEKNKEE